MILPHKSEVVFQGLKILLFLNYNYALLWHWETFMTAIKVRCPSPKIQISSKFPVMFS
ncbi:hypothetical protein LEMLEM_LOCUS7084 [Lemmus lemmus]